MVIAGNAKTVVNLRKSKKILKKLKFKGEQNYEKVQMLDLR